MWPRWSKKQRHSQRGQAKVRAQPRLVFVLAEENTSSRLKAGGDVSDLHFLSSTVCGIKVEISLRQKRAEKQTEQFGDCCIHLS